MNDTPASSLRAGGRRQLIGTLPKNGIGAEIGVWKGDFSKALLKDAKPREIHLIDPWTFRTDYPQRWYGGLKARDQHDMDAMYRRVVARFANNPQVRIHRLRSEDALELFPDKYFDWVYIDGDHSYAAVLQDLMFWAAKVTAGGILAGDDYQWRDETGQLSVARAVRDFAVNSGSCQPELWSGQFKFQL